MPIPRDHPDGTLRALVTGVVGGRLQPPRRLLQGHQLTFGRERIVDVCFPDEPRLSRLAGTLRGLSEGVAVTNLSRTHDLFVSSGPETMRLAATAAGVPVASLLLGVGAARIGWQGADGSEVRLDVRGDLDDETPMPAQGTARSTLNPLKLNELTKEFVVALFLCRPRLRAVPGANVTPNAPELTRQILVAMSSFALVAEFDNDKAARARLVSRTYEHLKSLRDKLVRAGLAMQAEGLSPESIAGLLVDNAVVRSRHLDLLRDEQWLSRQEREWEQ